MAHHSDDILNVVESFLGTRRALRGKDVRFLPRVTGENETVRMMRVQIGQEEYLVICNRLGG